MHTPVKKTRNQASWETVIATHEFMKTVLSKVEGTDLWEYRDHYSDSVVAKEMSVKLNTPVSDKSVENMRRKFFGQLKHVTPDTHASALYARIVKLEESVAALSTLVNTTMTRANQLLDAVKKADTAYIKTQSSIDLINEDIRKINIEISRLKLKGKFS